MTWQDKIEGMIMGFKDRLEALEKKYSGIIASGQRNLTELKEQIAELRAIEKVSLDTIEVISKDYKDIKEGDI